MFGGVVLAGCVVDKGSLVISFMVEVAGRMGVGGVSPSGIGLDGTSEEVYEKKYEESNDLILQYPTSTDH